MKTKYIFSTFMLASLAAACTNEEFEVVNSNVTPEGRIELGKISLSLGGEETGSRYIIGPNFNDLTAEVGDEVGACLIDIPNSTNNQKEAKYNYNLTSYISTNYSFKFDGSLWNSEAKMVEGNYFFYAPYNPNHATRKSIVAKLNQVQQLQADASGKIDATSTIEQLKDSKEVMLVGHKFISVADGTSISAELLPLYAYPLVTLTNNYKVPSAGSTEGVPTDLVINQVVVSKTDGFVTEAEFDLDGTSTSSNAISVTDGVVNALRNFSYVETVTNKVKEAKGLFAEKNGSKGAYTTSLLNSTAISTSSAIVVKAPNNAYTLKAGETTQFHVVLPAADYSSKALTVSVYTNKGVFEFDQIDGSIAAGKRYAQSEYKADGSLISANEAGDNEPGDVYTFTLSTVESNVSANIVATTEDLVTLIQNTDAGTNSKTLTVQPLNKNVEVNAAVMNAIKAKSNTGFTVDFTAPVTIATSINTNKTVKFSADAYIEEGDITLGNGFELAAGNQSNNQDYNEVIINGGNVSITEGAKVNETYNRVVVNNGANATIKVNTKHILNKGGNVTIPNTSTFSSINNDVEDGEITIGNGTTNTIITATTFNNTKGKLTVKAKTIATVANSSVIDNYGELTSTTDAGSVINNYGSVTSTSHNGLIDMKSASASVNCSSDGSGTGRIKNNIDAVSISKGTNHKVYYEFTEDVNGMLVPQAGIYDLIVLNGMTWSPTADQTLTVDFELVDATISLYTPEAMIEVKGMHIVKTNAINSQSVLKGNNTAKIYSNNVITGDSGAILTVSNVEVKENGNTVVTKTF